ncbi:MAG TPA: chromate transporter [Casimicrobiaceae bacterium]|nr:chromate transporter [Casimicrobiaceae bacterium]
MSDSTATPAVARLSLAQLFFGFLKVGLSGFGGVMPFARRMIVEERRWLSEGEFLDVLSMSQFLPGPNIVNVSVIIGRRFQGAAGSLAAASGLLLMPLVIVLVLASVYAEYAQVPAVRNALAGMSAAASGLILATALKLARPIRDAVWQLAVCAVVFVAIALLRVPLLWVLVVMCPISFALAWRTRR